MEYRFNAKEWACLPVEEKIHRCHLMAEEARKLAETATPTIQKRYLGMAVEWENLAKEIEEAAKL